MKKKRSIQKLTIHKETISTLSKLTGGVDEPKPKKKENSEFITNCVATLILLCF